MALLGNYYLLHKLPLKFSGGVSTAALGIAGMRSNFNRADRSGNVFLNDSWDHKLGIPKQSIPPYCWRIPNSLPDARGMDEVATINGIGIAIASITGKGWITITASGTGAVIANILAPAYIQAIGIQGVGAVIAPMEAIADLDSSLSGLGVISWSSLTAIILASANLAGVGAVVASIMGNGWITITVPGTGAVISDITGLAFGQATIQGVGAVIAPLIATADLDSSLDGIGDISNASLAGAIYAASTIAGLGVVANASIEAKGILNSVIAGLGDIVIANLAGGLNALSSIAGVGSVIAPLEAVGWITVTIPGTGTVTAPLTAKAWLDAVIAGLGVVANANLTGGMNLGSAPAGVGDLVSLAQAKGWIGAEINIGFAPSAFDIAQAIWNAMAIGYNIPGTMGAKLNSAGGAADPWSTLLPGPYLAGSAGKIVGEFIDAKLSDIKAKTDNLPLIPADETLLEAILVDIKAKTDNIPLTPADETLLEAILVDIRGAGFDVNTDSLRKIRQLVSTLPTTSGRNHFDV
jgi:hypothetical protein